LIVLLATVLPCLKGKIFKQGEIRFTKGT